MTNRKCRRETAYAGLGTGVLLIVIYGALSYVGVVSGAIATIDPAKDTGATVLTNLTSSLFGAFGTAFLGIVFVIACLNVCTGLIGTCATYFHTRFQTVAGRTLSYRTWQVIFTVFSFIVSNAGLSAIIKVSEPVLSALYPIAIVLVLLALTHKSLGARFPHVYFWTVLLVGIDSFASCISSLQSPSSAAPSAGWTRRWPCCPCSNTSSAGWSRLSSVLPLVSPMLRDGSSSRSVPESGGRSVMAVVATLSGAGVSFAPLYERIWGGMMLHPNCPAIGRMPYYLSGQATDDYGVCVTSPLWFMTVTALSVVAILCLTVAGSTGLFAPSALFPLPCSGQVSRSLPPATTLVDTPISAQRYRQLTMQVLSLIASA